MAPDPIDLCTVAEVNAARRDISDGTFDDLTQAMITGASAAIMAWTGRRIRPLDTEPTARVFDPIPVGEREYLIDDLAAAPSAVTIQSAQGTLVATLDVVEDLVLLPRNRQAWEPIRRLRVRPGASAPGVGQTLTVTGLWGWPQVPADVRQAAIDTAIEWLKAHQALSNPSPDQFEPGTPPARALPLTARNLLGPYRRMGVA